MPVASCVFVISVACQGFIIRFVSYMISSLCLCELTSVVAVYVTYIVT